MYGAINTTSAEQAIVGGIDDGIDVQLCDIAVNNLDHEGRDLFD